MNFLTIEGSVIAIPWERIDALARTDRNKSGSAVVRCSDIKKELHKRIFDGKPSGQYIEIVCGESTRLESDMVLPREECLDERRTYRFLLVDLPRIWTNGCCCVWMGVEGRLKGWGCTCTGGDCSSVSDSLSNDVREIYSTDVSFCAVRNSDGALFAWGNKYCGGDCSSVHSQLNGDVDRIYCSKFGFAAVRKSDGFLFAWGDPNVGGDCSTVEDQLNGDIASIHSCARGFVAIRKTMSFFSSGAAQTYVRASVLVISATIYSASRALNLT